MSSLNPTMVGDFIIVLFVLLSAIVSCWSAVKVFGEMRKPSVDREKRISILEKRADENAKHIQTLNAATKLMLKSNSVMIEHLLGDGDKKELEDMAGELKQYLWNHIDN